MRYTVAWGVVFVSVFAVEGTSSARTTTLPGHLGVQTVEDEREFTVEIVHDPALEGIAVFAEVDRASGIGGLARMDLCHISRHPRDGLRPEQHACPLFIAAAGEPASLAITPGESQIGATSAPMRAAKRYKARINICFIGRKGSGA